MKKFRNFIDGKHTDAADGSTLDIINPATGKVYATSPNSKQADVDAAMNAAQRAFDVWKESTPSERSLALFRIADAIEARKDEFIATEVENCGKPVSITTSEEIPPMVDQIRFFAGAARMLEGKSAGEYMKGFTSMIRREPVGVCAQVAPWNYPMMMAVWKFAPAIAAGNSIVLKPSDTTPATTVLLAEIANEFLPQGVFNVVCGDRDTGRTMVSHATPSMVSVTGSVRAGMEVAEAAAKSLKRVHLELGGKAPVIVFDDADLEAAAAQISMTGYFNAGQDCTAATRVIVGPKVYGDFVEALAAAAKNTKTGQPNDDVLYGALNNANQLARVSGFVERAPKHARVVAGGNKIGNNGYFFEPTVLIRTRNDMTPVSQEIFGPVLCVQSFGDGDLNSVARDANSTIYGLSGSVWTRDLGCAMQMVRRIDAGQVSVNMHAAIDPAMPFGGNKQSGWGREFGKEGLEPYLKTKGVSMTW